MMLFPILHSTWLSRWIKIYLSCVFGSLASYKGLTLAWFVTHLHTYISLSDCFRLVIKLFRTDDLTKSSHQVLNSSYKFNIFIILMILRIDFFLFSYADPPIKIEETRMFSMLLKLILEDRVVQ